MFPVGAWAIWIIIVVAIVAVVVVVVRFTGVQIPQWVIQIGWILVVAFIAILAIKMLMGMG